MKKVLFVLLLACLTACKDEILPEAPMPYAVINKVIDLNNFNYLRLKFDRGYVYEEGGVKGLIIYRKSASQYLVFERNCTFEVEKGCRVEVDATGFFIKDPCCNSQFDLDGQPTSGRAAFPLVQYRAALSGSYLYINN